MWLEGSCMTRRNPHIWRAMAARRIRQLGDPILRVRCTPVEDPKSPAVRLLSDDLRDTLRTARKKYDMGRALAAPQIGAPVRRSVARPAHGPCRISCVRCAACRADHRTRAAPPAIWDLPPVCSERAGSGRQVGECVEPSCERAKIAPFRPACNYL